MRSKRKKKRKAWKIDRMRSGERKQQQRERFWKQVRNKELLVFRVVIPEEATKGLHGQEKEKAVEEYLAQENLRAGGIVDSGARAHISRIARDFCHIDRSSKVSLRGVGGKKEAHWGTLKPNRLGIECPAVFCEQLPVDRLFSTEQLNRDGWTITLAPTYKSMENEMGDSIILGTTEGGLPFLNDLEFHSNKEIHAFIGKMEKSYRNLFDVEQEIEWKEDANAEEGYEDCEEV